MTKATLIKLAKDRKLPEGAFDELVHECKAAEAAGINNDGLEEQIDYLLTQMSPSAIAKEIIEQTERPTTSTIQSILGLVSIEVDIETINSWTEEQQDQVIRWAGAVHCRASDNNCRVPKKPDFLPDETPNYEV